MILRDYMIKYGSSVDPGCKVILIDDCGQVQCEKSLDKAMHLWSQSPVITAFSQLDLSGKDNILFIYLEEFV